MFKNCTHVVRTLLCEGTHSYKAIANEARKHFPNAQTTDKSVASIAREMRKAGTLVKKSIEPIEPIKPTIDETQMSMFEAFEAKEFQLSLF